MCSCPIHHPGQAAGGQGRRCSAVAPPPAQRRRLNKDAVNVSLSQIYSFIRYLNTFCSIGCFCQAAAFFFFLFSIGGIKVVAAQSLSFCHSTE